ncbi:hypothetical protein chiPu_0014837 [Chiloscyllium punctatum]|uniref:Ig-like domain-containing protein n=1 Tax=Chiloscyllium punctatum TaxID=137246 RepID=A0A401T115_CHIPU|nr:hypothetical protein [Chiloscyllium punctatum]
MLDWETEWVSECTGGGAGGSYCEGRIRGQQFLEELTCAPRFPDRPRDVSIDGGGSARESETLVLTCQGDANPEANITWGRREAGDEQLRWNISKSRGKSELRIDSLRRDDQGLYECVVENPLGTVRLEAQLNVEFPVKPDLEDIILGLCVPLVSLLGIGVLIYLIRKRLFKDLTQGKSSMSEDRSSNVPPSAPMQSSPC